MAINTNIDLVGSGGRPVVTPQAVEQLADAFRKGFVSADDIMERVSERTRTKQELELVTAQQGIAEATDPQLIEAKRSQQLLAGDQAAQTRDLLPLARRATEEKLNADIRSGQIARYGLKEKLEALNNVGFAPAPDPDKGITPEFALEVNKKFGTMLRWQKKKADGIFNAALFEAGEIVVPSGETFRGPRDKVIGDPGDPKQISQWRKDAAMTLPEFLLAEPGEVVAPIAVQPAAPLVQPALPTQPASAPLIQPMLPAQSVAPVIQPSGVPPGFTQVKPAPAETLGSASAVKREDALQREAVNLDAMKNKIAQARQLIATPGVVGPLQRPSVQAWHKLAAIFSDDAARTYTNQDQLNNVIADEIANYVQDWKGAISNVELQFFKQGRPRIDSTAETWKNYLDRWEAKTEEIKKIVAGELAPPDPVAWAANPRSSATVTTATPPPALPASPSAVRTISTPQEYQQLPSGTEYIDPSGKQRRKL